MRFFLTILVFMAFSLSGFAHAGHSHAPGVDVHAEHAPPGDQNADAEKHCCNHGHSMQSVSFASVPHSLARHTVSISGPEESTSLPPGSPIKPPRF